MAGIGEASAIIGVAQVGLSLAQTLVTFIGDYRDAAEHINSISDEINLTAIALESLGNLAKQNRLTGEKGVLAATNLRERCRNVFYNIRSAIKKGNAPLTDVITKEQIDVDSFHSLKWAVWTKWKIEASQTELDRLKDSLNLLFHVQKAAMADTVQERLREASSIVGNYRRRKWAEEKYRQQSQGNDAPNRGGVPSAVQDPRAIGATPVRGSGQHAADSYAQDNPEGSSNIRPIYTKINKSYLLPETLEAFGLPWEWDSMSPDNLIIKRSVDPEMRDKLFVHTRRLKESKELNELRKREREAKIVAANEAARREAAEREAKNDQALLKRLQDANIPEDQIARVFASTNAGFANLPKQKATGTASESSKGSFMAKFRRRPKQEEDLFNPLEGPYELESWSLDEVYPWRVRIPMPEKLLSQYLANRDRKDHISKIWARYTKLHPWFKGELQSLFKDRSSGQHNLMLISLEKSKNRAGFMRSGNLSLQVILKRTKRVSSDSETSSLRIHRLGRSSTSSSRSSSTSLSRSRIVIREREEEEGGSRFQRERISRPTVLNVNSRSRHRSGISPVDLQHESRRSRRDRRRSDFFDSSDGGPRGQEERIERAEEPVERVEASRDFRRQSPPRVRAQRDYEYEYEERSRSRGRQGSSPAEVIIQRDSYGREAPYRAEVIQREDPVFARDMRSHREVEEVVVRRTPHRTMTADSSRHVRYADEVPTFNKSRDQKEGIRVFEEEDGIRVSADTYYGIPEARSAVTYDHDTEDIDKAKDETDEEIIQKQLALFLDDTAVVARSQNAAESFTPGFVNEEPEALVGLPVDPIRPVYRSPTAVAIDETRDNVGFRAAGRVTDQQRQGAVDSRMPNTIMEEPEVSANAAEVATSQSPPHSTEDIMGQGPREPEGVEANRQGQGSDLAGVYPHSRTAPEVFAHLPDRSRPSEERPGLGPDV